MKRSSISSAALLASSLATLSLACGAPAGTPAADGARRDDANPTGTSNGNGAEVGTITVSAPPKDETCGVDPMPSSEPCSVHESYGVFVSATKGSPEGDGSRTAPLDSLAAAILLAKKTQRRVYACAEIYRESVVLEESVDMFGYFDCSATWKHKPFTTARIDAPTSPAVAGANILLATRFVGFEVHAPNATAPGASSIAMRLVRAPGVEIAQVHLEAGDAAHGADGAPGIQLVQIGAIHGAAGASAISQLGCPMALGVAVCNSLHNASRPGGVSTCKGATGFDGGPGGAGGMSGIYYRNADGVVLAKRLEQVGNVPTSQTARGAYQGTYAADGANGASGKNGESATKQGTLDENGFVPASGARGTNGTPGQGGGGGSATQPDHATITTAMMYGASGAGGGAGGCPGLAGEPGQGGGASIALLAYESPVRIDRSQLRSGRGGNAGRAGLASAPTVGGAPGASVGSFTQAGGGGDGGHAGASGHGAAGPSIAIAHVGAMPTLTNTVVTRGTGGAGQPAVATATGSISSTPNGEASETRAF